MVYPFCLDQYYCFWFLQDKSSHYKAKRKKQVNVSDFWRPLRLGSFAGPGTKYNFSTCLMKRTVNDGKWKQSVYTDGITCYTLLTLIFLYPCSHKPYGAHVQLPWLGSIVCDTVDKGCWLQSHPYISWFSLC